MARLTIDDYYALKELEERLVANGVALYGEADAPKLAALVAAGDAREPSPGAFVLTRAGWRVVHAFREHLAAHQEQASVSGLPPFVEPEDPDVRQERLELARDIFVRARASDRGSTSQAAADAAVEDAAAFLERVKL